MMHGLAGSAALVLLALQTGRLRNGLSGVIGISTMSLGAYTIYDMGLSGGVLFGWL